MNACLRGLLLVSALTVAATGVPGQSTQQSAEKKKEESVAEAARRAREQRSQKPAAQPLKEFTNDSLPPARVAGESAGASPTSEAPGSSGAAAQDESKPVSAEEEKERGEADAAVKAEREKLEKLKGEMELMERETKLNKSAFYGRPDFINDKAGAANLAAQDAALDAKKIEIKEAEAKIATLEEKAKAINERLGPKPEEPKTPEQQRDAWSEKIRPLRDELSKIEAELAAMNRERAAQGSTTNPPGAFTADRVAQLERRRAELQRQISDIEDDARRAGALPIRNE